MRNLVGAGADLLLGSRCPGCDRPGFRLCANCRAAVAAGQVHFAGRTPSPPGYPLTVAAGAYDEVLRRLVTGFKDRSILSLAPVLGERAGLAAGFLLAGVGTLGVSYRLVPIPSLPAAVRERGMDHTWAVARIAAATLEREAGLRLPVERLLLSAGGRDDQSGLDAAGRLANQVGRFRVRSSPVPLSPSRTRDDAAVILVDDLTTTGATLAEATRTLRGAGVRVLGAAVCAATVRRQRRS